MQNVCSLINVLRTLFTMYVDVPCIPTYEPILRTQYNELSAFFDMPVHRRRRCKCHAIYPQYLWDWLVDRDQRVEHACTIALVIDTRASRNLKSKNKNSTIHLPISCFSTKCRCHTRTPLANLSRPPPSFRIQVLAYLSDTSGHPRNCVKSEWVATVHVSYKYVGA